jgi:hypothetical protein
VSWKADDEWDEPLARSSGVRFAPARHRHRASVWPAAQVLLWALEVCGRNGSVVIAEDRRLRAPRWASRYGSDRVPRGDDGGGGSNHCVSANEEGLRRF